MTRASVYGGALAAFIAATIMTLASILTPDWLTYSMTASTGITVTRNIGLHRSCDSVSSPPCRHYPAEAECDGEERSFCSMWRTTGFLMNLVIVVELATVVGFLVILAGGKMKRETGWRTLGGLLGVVAAIQFAAMAIVAYLFDHDEQFIVPGWSLDTSFVLCTISGTIAVLTSLGLAASAYYLPPEGGYDFLHDPIGA